MMKPRDIPDELLFDVLRDDRLDALRSSLHQRCLAELARRRRPRTLPLVLAAAAVLALTVRIFFWTAEEGPPMEPAEAALRPWLIRTVPLQTHQIITTPASGTAVAVVHTREHRDLAVATPSPAAPAIEEEPALIAEVNDEELLAMFAGAPRALISTREGGKRLKFFDPGDEARFLVPAE